MYAFSGFSRAVPVCIARTLPLRVRVRVRARSVKFAHGPELTCRSTRYTRLVQRTFIKYTPSVPVLYKCAPRVRAVLEYPTLTPCRTLQYAGYNMQGFIVQGAVRSV